MISTSLWCINISIKHQQHIRNYHDQIGILFMNLFTRLRFFLDFFSVRFLSVLQDHFSSPPQRSMTSDFEGFLSQMVSVTFCPIVILQKEPVFPFFNVQWQTRELVPFYTVFGVTRSLTGDWTLDLPHSKPSLYQ